MTAPKPDLRVVPPQKEVEIDMNLYRSFWIGRDPENGLVRIAVEDMIKSGLSPEILEKAGVTLWSRGRDELVKALGRAKIDGLEMLQTCELAEFKNFDESGTYKFSRFRLYPAVHGFKYMQPRGIPAQPWIISDVWATKEKNNIPLWITEGEKKALKLMQHGENCVSLPGVWNFKAGKKDDHAEWRDKQIWGSLREFRMDGRTVFLAFDNDLWTNPGVRYALYELGIKLYALGALVRIVVWSGAKGIDDYLVAAPFVSNAISNLKECARDLFSFIQPDHQAEVIRALSVIELSPVRAEQMEGSVAKAIGVTISTLRKELKHRKENLKTTPDFIQNLNEKFALIHGLSEIWDIDLCLAMKSDAFKLLHPNVGKIWLDSKEKRITKKEDIVFEPAGCEPHQINLFKEWPLKPDPKKPHQKIVNHILHMTDYDESSCHWLTCWLAWPLQHPGTKMDTSVIIHGPQGTGKGRLFDPILKIYGQYGCMINQGTLESPYTGWISRRLFVVANEVISNLQQLNLKNEIKGLITEPTVWVNQKFVASREEKNHSNIVFLSNEDVPLLIDSDDRRFFVLRVENVESGDYFKALSDEIDAGGAEGLYHYLLNYDTTGFDGAHAKPPKTQAKEMLSQLCERTPERFLRSWKAEEIPVNFMTALSRQIYALYVLWCNESNEHAFSETRFGRFMSKKFKKRHSRQGKVYQILKSTEEFTKEDADIFQGKLEEYRKSILAVKAR